jgi:hypothetical protein
MSSDEVFEGAGSKVVHELACRGEVGKTTEK